MEITFPNFILLHNHLVSILSTNNFENQNLPQKVMQYIGMIVDSEKDPQKSQDFFDYFCENNGNKILRLTLEADAFLAVKVLSLLFINLKSQSWISFLLCQQFITDAIQYNQIPDNQQWVEYYISLLKSLSIRLNQEHLSLFFNKKLCKFPLLYESLKYYNHPDCMVRTNVMNIILGVMKLKDQKLSQYFGSFPFTSYILTYCCQIEQRIKKFDIHLLQWDYHQGHDSPTKILSKHKSIVKMYYVDMTDYIWYLNDLIELGPKKLAFFIKNAIYQYILIPALNKLKPQTKPILKKSAMHTIFLLLKSINDNHFTQTVCLLVFGKNIPKYYADKINNIENNQYIPKIYSQQFSVANYYWNKFEYQIENRCLRVFDDIANFSTEHESQVEDPNQKQLFLEEINKISETLGFNILTYQEFPSVLPVTDYRTCLNFSKENRFQSVDQDELAQQKNFIRQSIMQVYERACEEADDDMCLCISMPLIYCIKSDRISNVILQFCGILMPRFDMVNYLDEFNMVSLMRLKNSIINCLANLNKTFNEKQVIMDYTLANLRNIMYIFDSLTFKPLPEDEQAILLEFYQKCLKQIKYHINLNNMKNLVENFEFDLAKWNKEAIIPDHNLPYSVFMKYNAQLLGEIQLHFLKGLSDPKARVQYFIRYLAIFQAFYYRYIESIVIKGGSKPPVLIEKYQIRYQERFSKVEDRWKLSEKYEIEFRNMVECRMIEKNNKMKKVLIVEDPHNLVIVQPSKDQNTARIILNNPWKYVAIQIDRTNGKKMTIKIIKCVKGESILNLIYSDDIRSASTLQWMNQLKYQRSQEQQALILSYIKDCMIVL